jgi:23S rRNA pseudouridine2605 synthase
VRVRGRIVRDPICPVELDRAGIMLDGESGRSAEWRSILLNKPRGVVTTRRDPEGRRTVFDVIGESAPGLLSIGRLDLATTGLLLLTTDTQLANWITDPVNAVPRVYLVTVRGRVTGAEAARLEAGVGTGDLRAYAVAVRKASGRESHLTVELREGRNRQVRRLFEAIGHEVTRLKRVQLGGLVLGDLPPGAWRALSRDDVHTAFPALAEVGAPAASGGPDAV